MNNKKTAPNKATTHSFSNDALAYDDTVGLIERLKNKEVSPQELLEASIKRSQLINPSINAIVTDCFESPVHGKDNSLFSGIPTYIKDNLNVKGIPTKYGSAALRNAEAQMENDPYFDQLLASGFSVIGKSQLPEFGLTSSTEFQHAEPCRNPWNLDYSVGASSGGAAALVASGAVSIAHANDGGGSIRIPAACCGLIGLKPTRGRHIVTLAAKDLPVNIVNDGVLTRSVRDTAYFHADLEKTYRNPNLPALDLVTQPSKKRLRIVLLEESITNTPTDEETKKALHEAAKLLESMGHIIITDELPIKKSLINDFKVFWGSMAFSIELLGKKTISPHFDKKGLDSLTRQWRKEFTHNFYRYPFALRRLKQSEFDYKEMFEDFDLILSPTLAKTPLKLGELKPNEHNAKELIEKLMAYSNFTPLANATGAPAISLPFSQSEAGLPISIHFSAKHGDEKTLLEIAYEIEAAKPWARIYD